MMRKSIFTLMFLAAISYVSAQSLQFELNGTVFSEGETIVCTNDEYGYGEYIQHMQLRNLTSSDMNVVVEKEVVENLDGTMNWFCWGMCFGPDVYVSPAGVPVLANSLNTDDLSFHVLFEEQVFGAVTMRYSAYDEHNPDARVTILVKFHKSGEGVIDTPTMHFGQPYPNPATSTVRFDYYLTVGRATAVVYNLLGQEMLREELNTFEGQLKLSVADLQNGIYFCSIMIDGQAYTTVKFVVKK